MDFYQLRLRRRAYFVHFGGSDNRGQKTKLNKQKKKNGGGKFS